MDSLNILSDEVLLEILRHLDIVELSRSGCINKRLRGISEDNTLWEQFQPDTKSVPAIKEYDDMIRSEFKTATLKHRARLWKSWWRYREKINDISDLEVGRHAFRSFSVFTAPFFGLFTIIPHMLCSFLISPLYKAKLLALLDSPLSHSTIPLLTLWNIITEQGVFALFDGWYMYLLSTILAMVMPIHGHDFVRYLREILFLLILSSVDRVQARVPFFSISILHYLLATGVFLLQRRLYMAFFRRFRFILGEYIFYVSAFAFIWFDAVVIRCVTATPQDSLFSTMYASFIALFSFKLWTAALFSYPMRTFTTLRVNMINWFGTFERKLRRYQARREFLKQVAFSRKKII
jgi:hypothetical protein